MSKNKFIERLIFWLTLHHFTIVGLSGLVSGMCIVPKIINSGAVIFDAEFANYAFQIASELFRCHKMTKLLLPSRLVYAFILEDWLHSHSERSQIIDKSIEALFFFVSVVDYIYFFYALYQKCSDEMFFYEDIYLTLLCIASGFDVCNIIIENQKIKSNVQKFWDIVWYTKCPEVIIKT